MKLSGPTIPQTGFGHFWGPYGFWPFSKITRSKVQNSLLRAINLDIYSMVYYTVEYLAICTSGQQSCTICSRYPIWAGSWPTSHFAVQAMSEFQFGWSQPTHWVWPHLACPQLTRLDASNRLLKVLVPTLALEGSLIQSSAYTHPSNPSPPSGYSNNFFGSQYNR